MIAFVCLFVYGYDESSHSLILIPNCLKKNFKGMNLRVGHSDRGDVLETTLKSNHWNPPERERELIQAFIVVMENQKEK